MSGDDTDDAEMQQVEKYLNKHKIPAKAISVAIVNGRPVIEIGRTQICFEVHYVDREGGGISTVRDETDVEWDADPDAGPWFTIFEDFDEAYIEIDPILDYTDEQGGSDAE